MSERHPEATPPYEPPRLVPLGSVHELTLDRNKWLGGMDGDWFMGNQGMHTVS
jgi:hypothetical protein